MPFEISLISYRQRYRSGVAAVNPHGGRLLRLVGIACEIIFKTVTESILLTR